MRSVLIIAALMMGASTARAETIGQYEALGPFTHGLMTVYALRGADTADADAQTLDDAMAAKAIKVRETGNVNELVVQNTGKKKVYLQGGEVVKGGRQDRVIEHDTMIEPGKTAKLKVYCVEQGRWQPRGNESSTTFDASTKQLVGKAALSPRLEKDQSKVWASVQSKQDALSKATGKRVNSFASPTSMQLALEDKDVEAAVAAYAKAFADVPDSATDVIGFAYGLNGQAEAVEILPSHAIMKKQWKKLVDGAASEAVAMKPDVVVTKPVTVAAFAELLRDADAAPEAIERVAPNVEVKTKQTAKSVLIESQAAGNHRKTYVKK